MNKDQAIQVIIFECVEIDGFLVKLRSKRDFNDEQFQKLVEAIQVYRDAIVGENCINRHVAGCLFYVEMLLGDVAAYFNKYELTDKEKITNAHAKLWEVLESIYEI